MKIRAEMEYLGLKPKEIELEQPVLLAVVDTEEEFDWREPHSRRCTSTRSIENLNVVQKVFDDEGMKPCYVVDYPVATSKLAKKVLTGILDTGRCEIGTHLHPWVSPPHDEKVGRHNSFPGNLPHDLERRKLVVLTNAIEQNFGVRPLAYKAGRYGLGANTIDILWDLGYRVDLSLAPPYDYSSEGGPNFGQTENTVHVSTRHREFLSIPCTGAYTGPLAFLGHRIYPRVAGKRLLSGVLARTQLLQRIRLSPEGFTLRDLMALTRHLVSRRKQSVLTLTFHSPSVQVGNTPYVRSEADLINFTQIMRGFLRFFKQEMGGVYMTPSEFSTLFADSASVRG